MVPLEGLHRAAERLTIFASTVIHGLTATATVAVLDREYSEGAGAPSNPDAETSKRVI